MSRFAAATIVVLLCAALRMPAQVQQPESPGTSKAGEPDKGVIEGHTYKNKFLNLEFTPAADLEFRPPEMSGKPGEKQHSVGVSAWSKAHNKFSFRKYIVERGVIFVADDLDSYGEDERTAAGYLRHVSQVEAREGFKPIEGPAEAKVSEVKLARGNFKQGDRLHIVCITTRYGYAFTFVFVANDMEAVEAMIKETTLKLPE